ncbi:transcriptional regulator family: Centromere protein B DNA-binding region [Penicillium paradoxum]|uniref:transcriptional regulator family: Centromere protein B DNA-binding region n=1 Tax=Penicillium paradoxum TaxID=176176 RepID=UPI00254804FC|nr:transcriptional regulator family: Centromere protein B DNA-binding region [Penicillium paradoxum]KAJ5773060.1 transcriptional regulator family: Centromere protein B DNA-binding region [Penicillium paradoxum]
MPNTNAEIEAQISKAIASLSDQSKPNISKTAREFAVPESRLRRRWKGGKSLFQRQPNGRKLSFTQEAALCRFIDSFDQADAPVTRAQITDAANSILEKSHTDPSTKPPKSASIG